MHVNLQRSRMEDIAEASTVMPRLAVIGSGVGSGGEAALDALIEPGPRVEGGRYGEAKRPSLPTIGLIALAHVAALYALTTFDVISLKKKTEPTVIEMVIDAPPPAEIVPPTAPPPRDTPPPPDQPTPLIVSTAQTAAPLPIAVAPPPPVPVAPVQVAPPGPPAPPAPIIPPDVDASTMSNPAPVYPMESRRRHEQGTVRLRVVITVEGRVKEISVARSSGFDRLDKAALDAVRRWKFRPGTQAGIPVEAVGTLAIPFSLA